MRKYFGTDGIRGVVGKDLTMHLAIKCGSALCRGREKTKIVIGGDTRPSRELLTMAFSLGAMLEGGEVKDVGVCTTPGIAYIAKKLGADFGVVISASHNPPEYNGIKIFDSTGVKLADDTEEELESHFDDIDKKPQGFGKYLKKTTLVSLYKEHLIKSCKVGLDGVKILLDLANGASFKVAPQVFKALGAEVYTINSKNNGSKINENCGSTHPESLAEHVKKISADVGFAFDGDADRLIACDENGRIIDGDQIIFMLAKYFKKNSLDKNIVVGTTHTNMGIEKALVKMGITLQRADVGDKYVIEKMEESGAKLGGEKSGHVILKDYATTGDGILTAIKIAEMMKVSGKKISKLCKVNLYPQCSIDVLSCNKIKIMASRELENEIEKVSMMLGKMGKVIVRPSGTEPKIRIMVECKKKRLAKTCAERLSKTVASLEEGILCAE